MKVGHRHQPGFALVLVLLLGAVGLALWKMSAMAAASSRIVTVCNVEQNHSRHMMVHLQPVQSRTAAELARVSEGLSRSVAFFRI